MPSPITYVMATTLADRLPVYALLRGGYPLLKDGQPMVAGAVSIAAWCRKQATGK